MRSSLSFDLTVSMGGFSAAIIPAEFPQKPCREIVYIRATIGKTPYFYELQRKITRLEK
jgi:hypothetical protein